MKETRTRTNPWCEVKSFMSDGEEKEVEPQRGRWSEMKNHPLTAPNHERAMMERAPDCKRGLKRGAGEEQGISQDNEALQRQKD